LSLEVGAAVIKRAVALARVVLGLQVEPLQKEPFTRQLLAAVEQREPKVQHLLCLELEFQRLVARAAVVVEITRKTQAPEALVEVAAR
jgi:hypothetical protein